MSFARLTLLALLVVAAGGYRPGSSAAGHDVFSARDGPRVLSQGCVPSPLRVAESSRPVPARPGSRSDIRQDTTRPHLTREEYLELWRGVAGREISAEGARRLEQIFDFVPPRYDSSGLRRMLLSLPYLSTDSLSIPEERLHDFSMRLVDLSEIVRFMDVERTRRAFHWAKDLTPEQVASAYLDTVSHSLDRIQIIPRRSTDGVITEIRVHTRNEAVQKIPVFFAPWKPGPKHLTLTIDPGTVFRISQVADDTTRGAALAVVRRRSRLLGTPVPRALLAQAPGYFAHLDTLPFPAVLARLQGMVISGHYHGIPFAAHIDQMVIAPGLFYKEEKADYETNAPLFLAVQVKIRLLILLPGLLKMMLF